VALKPILAVLLLSSIAMAQATPTAQTAPKPQSPATAQAKPEAKKPASPAAELSATAPVITIEGVCAAKPATEAECKTVVTKAQFDNLLDAINPAGPGQINQIQPAQKRRFGDNYAKMLALAVKAERENLQNTPRVKALQHFAQLQALATEMARNIQENSKPTPADIQKFYQDNAAKFQEYTMERLFVPLRGADGKELDKATVEPLAAKLRERAAAGEPFEKLEKEAYDTLKLQTPPATSMTVPEGALPPSQTAVYTLKPGEVSQMLNEPSGFYIYKLVSKQQVPIDKVRDEISKALQQEKAQAAVDAILKSGKTVLNEAYFGPPTPEAGQSALPGGAAVRPRPRPTVSHTPNAAPANTAPPQQH
jgi:hypothetical protein